MSSKFLDKTGLDTLWAKIKSTFQTLGNLVTAWGSTPSDAKYPSEKLVKAALDGKVDAANVRLYTDTANTQYYKIAECNAPADYTNAALSLDYWISRAIAKSERGILEISTRPLADGSYGINHFAAYQQKKVGTTNYGLSFILTMATVGETVHMELWASLSQSYVGLFASSRFSKRNGRNDGTSIWTFIENPEATATAPIQPSGGLIATATPSFDVKMASTSAVGSPSVPTYVDDGGEIKACTDDFVHDGDVEQTYSSTSTAPISGKGVDAAITNKMTRYSLYYGDGAKYKVLASVPNTTKSSGTVWSIMLSVRFYNASAFGILQGHGSIRCSWLFNAGEISTKVLFYTAADPNNENRTLIIAYVPNYYRIHATSFCRDADVDFSVWDTDEPEGTTHTSDNLIKVEQVAQSAASSGTAPVKVDDHGELVAVPMDSTPTASSTNLMTSGAIKTALDGKSDKTSVVAIADAYARASNVSNMWCKVAEFTWTGTKSTFASSWMVTFIASSGAMTSESFFLNFAIRANESGAPTLRTFATSIINTPSTANSRRFKMVISGSSGNMTMKLYYFNGASNYSSMTIREIMATAQSSASKSKGTWAYTSYTSGSGDTTEPTGDYNYECTFVYASSLAVASAGTATTAQNYDASTGTIKTALEGKANLNSYGYIATSNIPVIQYRASSASTLRICRVPSPSTSTMSVLECNVRWASSYARIIIQSRGWVANVIGASLESYGLAFYKQAVTVDDATYYDIIAVIPSYCRCVFAASFLWYNSNLDFSVYGNVEYTPVAADKITYSYSAQALVSSGTAPVKVDALGNLSAVPMDSTPTPSSTNLMTSGAIAAALAGRAHGKTISLASGYALSVTIPWATRTGRSSMLVIVSGNNGVQSCVQVSWFKDANNSITNAKMNVLSYTNTGAGCVPMFYVQYGTQALGACGIYLVLDNSSWATQVTVIPNMENVDSVAFGTVAKSTAQTATDLSSERVWSLQGAWDGTPTLGSTNAVTSNGIATALAGKQDTLSSSDSGKVVAVGSTGSIIASVADVNDVNNIANYNRVHVEAIRGVSTPNNPTYMNVGLYRYDSNTAVMMPEQTGELNPGELIGTPVEILQFTNQNWNPMQLNCEDFVIIKNGYTSDLTDIWQLGKIVSNPKCRRFRVRFANADSYDWYINFCHTYNAGAYSGSISLITNKPGRYQTYYQVKVKPNKCVKVDIVLSTVGYNLSGDIIAIIDSDEPDEIT